jgi:hypothetical protein
MSLIIYPIDKFSRLNAKYDIPNLIFDNDIFSNACTFKSNGIILTPIFIKVEKFNPFWD